MEMKQQSQGALGSFIHTHTSQPLHSQHWHFIVPTVLLCFREFFNGLSILLLFISDIFDFHNLKKIILICEREKESSYQQRTSANA